MADFKGGDKMKIISSAKFDNIRITCKCCGCVFELETRDDFGVNYVLRPKEDGFVDYSIKIPEYRIKCPDCGREVYIGLDPHDTKYTMPNALCEVVTSRVDWEEKYKIEPIKV